MLWLAGLLAWAALPELRAGEWNLPLTMTCVMEP